MFSRKPSLRENSTLRGSLLPAYLERGTNCQTHLESMEKAEIMEQNDSGELYRAITPEDALNRVRTAGTVSMSPELFEKLYLSPQTNVHGDLRKTIGNPTPL